MNYYYQLFKVALAEITHFKSHLLVFEKSSASTIMCQFTHPPFNDK
ncbi:MULTISPECIES: hypothetical protein [unclassified Colwellia]|nr:MULTISPECIES: hypothetical protein [unclassified Colwellia]MBA6351582.1 hypothetical protein [Colwellia sp. BRX9-1]MBA6356597.1 hypothetical protein [Colwellia sp. BRX8-3]MBA6359383.1 hypothetical protein [Colwellia sp. BRX8-6]MBA6367995.1 hypothetical protein [Colwellia sp. BRX8-5]MBA6374250.1 hypothetical protein [Colwellia sp. BRX8-2]